MLSRDDGGLLGQAVVGEQSSDVPCPFSITPIQGDFHVSIAAAFDRFRNVVGSINRRQGVKDHSE